MQGVKNVILVHGAWADGSSWSRIIPLLEAKEAFTSPLSRIH